MPEHGLPTATAECCRPGPPQFMRETELKTAEPFWADRAAWTKAARNTFNCLVGCSIGDFAMLIYKQAYHPGTPMPITMVLAMTAGLITSILFEP